MRDPIPKEIRAEVKEKFGGQCAYCGIRLKKSFHVDHVIPVAAGGVDDVCNYFPACVTCNSFKNSSSLEEFRRSLELLPLKASLILAERFGMVEMISVVGAKNVVFHFEKQGHTFNEELVRALMKASPRL